MHRAMILLVGAFACSNMQGSGVPEPGVPAPEAKNVNTGDDGQQDVARETMPAGKAAQNGDNAVTGSSDTMERVQQAAGPGAEVVPWREAALPNIELFWLNTETASGKPNGRGIAVVDGQLPWLEGSDAMAAVVAAGVSDAPTLARVAILVLLGRGKLLAQPEDHTAPLTPAQKAAITPPAKTGNVLELWYFAGRPGTLKVRVDLTTWKTTTTPLDAVVQAGQDPIELARTWLQDPGDAVNKRGIDGLVAACADPRAPAALIDALKTHAKASTRAMAAAALARCKHASGVAALAEVLAKDGDVGVRKAAVEALGMLADPAARPALEKAAKGDPDADVRGYAAWALGKLPAP